MSEDRTLEDRQQEVLLESRVFQVQDEERALEVLLS